MRSSFTAAVMLGLALGVGLGLGLTLGRPAWTASAQVTNADRRAETTVRPDEPASSKVAGEGTLYEELDRQYAMFEAVNRTFELVARTVSPAVVHIAARKPPRLEETGSGVIVRPSPRRGLVVLTNHHVIEGAATSQVSILLHDGRVLKPLRIWSDSKADIAVLELGRNDLPAARLGDSDQAPVGTWVLALGSPFGLTHSVSHGIISARNRHEDELEDQGVENQEFLQTDAAINPGNSGGPLVNLRGEVIGINTAIASNGGGSEGVGFSIPINLAKWIMGQLVERGRVTRGALGVRLQEVHAQRAAEVGLERPRGARILSVQRPSPAAEAGLRDGDIVLKFNGVDVININHLINLVSMAPIGQEVKVVYWRDRRELTTTVAVADRDSLLASDEPPARTEPSTPLRRPARPPAPAHDQDSPP